MIDTTFRWDDGVPSRVRLAAAEGLNLAAEELKADSNELSPVDTGDNVRSSGVHPATIADLVAWVVYNMRYSVTIHEGVWMAFSTARNPKAQAKYLETPLIQNREKYLAIIGTRIQRAIPNR